MNIERCVEIMISKSQLCNNRSVAIFTDASLKTVNGVTSVCPGYAIYLNGVLIEQNFYILHNATVNQGELYAIMMGVYASVRYRQIGQLRLFSDSQTSIFAIRDRIFKWINNVKEDDGLLRGGDGQVILNQDRIMDVIYLVMAQNLPIEFYHLKGHINPNDANDMKKQREVFARSNGLTDTIDNELLRWISQCNDYIDRYTGIMLDMHIADQQFVQHPNAITMGYVPFDTIRYKQLIGVC